MTRLPPLLFAPLALLALGGGCTHVRYREAFQPEGAVEHIRVLVDSGRVELVAGETLRVERTIRSSELALHLSHEVRDGVLELQARCQRLLPCAVDTRIEVPAGVSVELDLGQGEVWASGVGSVRVELDEGLADLDLTGNLDASVGQGEVRARLERGAQARIGVGQGDIRVEVPSGPWDIQAIAERLDTSQVSVVSNVKGRLDLVAPAGSILVTGTADLARR